MGHSFHSLNLSIIRNDGLFELTILTLLQVPLRGRRRGRSIVTGRDVNVHILHLQTLLLSYMRQGQQLFLLSLNIYINLDLYSRPWKSSMKSR